MEVGGTVTVQAKAVKLASIPATCSEITGSAEWRDGTAFDLISGGISQGVKTQSGSAYAVWPSLASSTYTLSPQNDSSSTIRACLTDAVGTHFGDLSASLAAGGTATFDVAYSPAAGWFQTVGGDVYGAGTLSSLMPLSASPYYFNRNGLPAGGYPVIPPTHSELYAGPNRSG